MTVLQLVRGGEQGLEPLRIPEARSPTEMLRARGNDTFLAGSDDLIWIAFGLSLSNFRVLDFYFVNRYFEPLGEESEWLSDELIRLIEDGNPNAISRFIETHLEGRFVEQVRLHNGTTRNDMSVAQDGIVNAQDEDFASLSDALRRVNPYR
jgi:hypothetical protein